MTFTVKNGGTTVGTPVTSAALINGSATANYILTGGTPAAFAREHGRRLRRRPPN